MTPETAARQTSIRVRYAETDQMGVAYYANYLVWFEVGRTDWLRQAGATYRDMERDDGVALPVIEAHCDYRQPARYDDDLTITTTATLLTPVRVRFDYEVQRAPGQTPLAVGYTVHASVSAAGKPVRLPARVRRLLQDPPEPA